MVCFLSLALLASSFLVANANPAPYGLMAEFELYKRDTAFPATVENACVDFLIGQKPSGSQVCVSVDYDTRSVRVEYPTLPSGYKYEQGKQHVWVGCVSPNSGADVPTGFGQWPVGGDMCKTTADLTSATCTFKADPLLKNCSSCGKSFFIAVHSSMFKVDDNGVTKSDSAAGAGTPINSAPAWLRRFWNPTFHCLCTSTITYPPVTVFTTSTTTMTSTFAVTTTTPPNDYPVSTCS